MSFGEIILSTENLVECSGSTTNNKLVYFLQYTTTTTTAGITTTTTTICQRPSGLIEKGFYYMIKEQTGSTWTNFSGSLSLACAAYNLFIGGDYNFAGVSNNVESLEIGKEVWYNSTLTDCNLYNTGYYILISPELKVCYVLNGYINSFPSCATTTTTTATPTTTTTTTINLNTIQVNYAGNEVLLCAGTCSQINIYSTGNTLTETDVYYTDNTGTTLYPSSIDIYSEWCGGGGNYGKFNTDGYFTITGSC